MANLVENNDFSKQYRFLLELSALSFLAILFFWGGELFNLVITVDEELHAYQRSPNIGWLEQGRWGTFIINKYLVPVTVIPTSPLALWVFLSTAAYLVLWRFVFSKVTNDDVIKLTAFLIFVGHPFLAAINVFNTINYAIGFGWLSVSLAMALLSRKGALRIALSTILFAFSISIYQPFILAVVLVLMVEQYFSRQFFNIKSWAILIFKIASSLAFYYLIREVFFEIYDISPKYLDGFISSQSIIDNISSPMKTLSNVFKFMSEAYFGGSRIYLGNKLAVSFFSSSLLFLAMLNLAKGKLINQIGTESGIFQKVLGGIFVITVFSVPFLLHVASVGSRIPDRSMITFPLALVSLLVMVSCIDKSRWQKYLIMFASIWFIINCSNTINRHIQSNVHVRNTEKVFFTSVMPQVYDVIREESLQPPFNLLFIGKKDIPNYLFSKRQEITGRSYLEFGNANQYRINNLLKLIGYRNFRPVEEKVKKELTLRSKDKPNWPQEGSVLLIDNVIVVKL
jgi:hypothetical protein